MDSSALFILLLFSLLVLSLGVPHSHSFQSNQSRCHEEERNALLEFKATFLDESCLPNSIYGTNLKTWSVEGKNGDYFNWSGVMCDLHSGHVISLGLDGSCLSGSINSSNSIFKLTHLQTLDLSFNDFRYSKIPSAISNLSQLETLYLSYSNFFGQIPSEILNLTSLSYLDLSYNDLLTLKNPSLRGLVQSLLKLEALVLSHVEISSTVPDSLSRLSSLRKLLLSDCKLQGQVPPSVANLTKLEWIDLSYNQFTGEIFPHILKLTKLHYVDLSSNNFSGQIPRTISHLKDLTYLFLRSNDFSRKTHLDVFFQLDSLKGLDLSYNNFSVVIDSSIILRSKFWYLNLASCNLRSFPLLLRNQDSLEVLDLSSNDISGEVPQWFMDVGMDNLTYLNLSCNHLSGFEGNSPLLKWNLRYLDLRLNHLKGLLPIPSSNSTNLYYVVSNNQFSGELPTRICDLVDLNVFDIGNNNFSGIIPQCLVNLVGFGALTVLNLHNNSFNGPIPLAGTNRCNLMMVDRATIN